MGRTNSSSLGAASGTLFIIQGDTAAVRNGPPRLQIVELDAALMRWYGATMVFKFTQGSTGRLHGARARLDQESRARWGPIRTNF